jgi:hypothetical protein
LPCSFCKGGNLGNCIKLSPQKSKGINNDYLAASDKDLDLYKHTISKQEVSNSPVGGVFRQLHVLADARSPRYDALVFSILAWASRSNVPEDYRTQSSYYEIQTVRRLNFNLEICAIDTHEVFASNLLAWFTYSSCSKVVQAHMHFKGSLAMLNFLIDKYTKYYNDNDLKLFGPFIIDCANAWTIRNGVIPNRCTTFNQRVTYFNQLTLKGSLTAWYSGPLEAANSTLGNLFEVALTSMCQYARKELKGDFERDNVDHVLQYIYAELGDRDLHSALRTLYQSFQGAQTNHTTVEGQLITRLFHRLRSTLLLLTVLEAPSVQLGVLTPKAEYLGSKIISFCWIQAIRRDGPIEDYYMISWHNFCHLLLGGMVLSPLESPGGKCILHPRSDESLFMDC